MKIDHLTFTETIERLADRIGYTLRYDEGSNTGPVVTSGTRNRLIAAHVEAAKFYQEQLNSSPGAAHGREVLTSAALIKQHVSSLVWVTHPMSGMASQNICAPWVTQLMS